MSLIEVKNLAINFKTSKGLIQAVRDISFQLEEGESIGFVGESGSGKSVTSLAILDLLAQNAEIGNGQILFEGKNIFSLNENEKQKIRGAQISMIFQEPLSSLDPCYTIYDQIAEVIETHEKINKKNLRYRIIQLLQSVGIPDPESRMNSYPHELSGGMCQRIMIAIAMACRPKLLIADEPTTALDVTVQSQILSLISKIKKENKMSLILVSHDLGIIAQNTDKIIVMYAGEIVEIGSSKDILNSPKHPYTEALLKSIPAKYKEHHHQEKKLPSIPGVVPDLSLRPKGCQFAPRCNYAKNECLEKDIPLRNQTGQLVRCIR